MKTFIARLASNACAARARANTAVGAQARHAEQRQTSMEQQLRELDTLTGWPTHRIRSFLATQQSRPLR